MCPVRHPLNISPSPPVKMRSDHMGNPVTVISAPTFKNSPSALF